MRFTLRNVGLPHKIITQGRKRVGTVWQHADTKIWHGAIGKTVTATGKTEREAFDAVAAKYFGFDSAADLDAHNHAVRVSNHQRKQRARETLDRMMGGDLSALDHLLGIKR
jgi:hypothetical protein